MSESTGSPPRGRAGLVLLATFVLGLACGAALTVLGTRLVPRPIGPPTFGEGGRPPIEAVVRTLDLDADQRRELRRIVHRDRERMRTLLDETRREIRSILTPEQQEIFDRMRPRRRGEPGPGPRRFRRDRGGPPPAETDPTAPD